MALPFGCDVWVSDRWLVVADQRALFKGSPEEKPEAHAKSSPITYVDDVAAPLLVIQGSNDTRCPPRPMQAYLLRGSLAHPMHNEIPISHAIVGLNSALIFPGVGTRRR